MSRNAIVTGASGGIGRAVAQRLARDGLSVVLNYAGNAQDRADVTFAVMDRFRAEILHRLGLSDLLTPSPNRMINSTRLPA